jgi:hypothetical protein
LRLGVPLAGKRLADAGWVCVDMGQIAFVCRAKHAPAAGKTKVASQNFITIHEARWAYCAAGAETGHAWDPIEPVPLSALKLAEVAHKKKEPLPT